MAFKWKFILNGEFIQCIVNQIITHVVSKISRLDEQLTQLWSNYSSSGRIVIALIKL